MLLHAFPSMFVSLLRDLREFPENSVEVYDKQIITQQIGSWADIMT